MQDDKWNMLIEHAKKSFEDVDLRTEDLLLETGDGLVKQGTQEILEFTNPKGRFRLIRETKPVVLEKKMHYSHRQGDSARTEYVFSDTEKTHKMRFFKEDGFDEWKELEADNITDIL